MDSLERINSALITLSKDWPDSTVYNAVRYSLLSEGKRIRPILAIEAYKVVGGVGDDILPFACALEMIHTSSLIVDDIMDNDDYRRGKLSCHAKFGPGTAVLASHLISCEAFHRISEYPKICKELLGTTITMCKGQDAEVAEQKTGSLICSSLRIGAMVGCATKHELEALTVFGNNIGYLFQIRDDILDGDLPEQNLALSIDYLDEVFGPKAETLKKIAHFIVERTV